MFKSPNTGEGFPFGEDFQKALLKLIISDYNLAAVAIPYLQAGYFESAPLQWFYSTIIKYYEKYGAIPSAMVMREQVRSLDVRVRPLFSAITEQVLGLEIADSAWLKDNLLDFIHRAVFVKAFHEARDLYNAGQAMAAYDTMRHRMEEMSKVTFAPPEREWYAEGFAQRQIRRLGSSADKIRIPTGFSRLDRILGGGGLCNGELGLWQAYAKGGKSTMLCVLGGTAVQLAGKQVLHVVLEGSKDQVGNRYDSAITGELYNSVKAGDFTDFSKAQAEFQHIRQRLVLRGMTDRWDYTVEDIFHEIQDLRRINNWVPDLIIVDYGDLLSGRGHGYENETARQIAAYRDLKSLANRGYAIWSASQAQRPAEGAEDKPHLLRSRNIADAYAKIRIADFIGSINQTREERKAGVLRLYAELYRDNEADEAWTVRADFSRMHIWEDPTAVSPSQPTAGSTKLGYGLIQSKVPV